MRIAAIATALLLAASACNSGSSDTTTSEPAASASVSSSTAAPETTAPQTTIATTTSTTTTTAPSTTVTTVDGSTSTTSTTTPTPTTTSTSVPPPADNEPPIVEIISPTSLSSHTAVYDASTERFGAAVSLSAVVSDPNGDPVTVQWISSDEGYLGSGESIVAVLHTGHFDSAQPRITARAIDQWNAAAEASVQIIVWIPSDS